MYKRFTIEISEVYIKNNDFNNIGTRPRIFLYCSWMLRHDSKNSEFSFNVFILT